MKTWKLYTVRHKFMPEVQYELGARDERHLNEYLSHVFNSWVFWFGWLVYGKRPAMGDFLVGEVGTFKPLSNQKYVKVLSSRLGDYRLASQTVPRSQREQVRQSRAKVATWVVGSSAYGMDVQSSDVDTLTVVFNSWSEKNGLATFPREQGDNSVYDLLSMRYLMDYSWKHYGDVSTEPVTVFDQYATDKFLNGVGGVTSALLQRALQLMYAYQGGTGESRMPVSTKGWAHSLRVAFELAYCQDGRRLQHPLPDVKKYCRAVRLGNMSMVDAGYMQADVLQSLRGAYAWLKVD